jgi:predicted nucleotidyltransferase
MEKLRMKSDPKLPEIVNRLVKTYQPLRIYLFGSRARYEAGPDSDYDLMMVVPDDASLERKRAKLAYDCLWGELEQRWMWWYGRREPLPGDPPS